MPVGALDESLERQRASVGGLNRKDMGGVVTPRPVCRELGHRHDLDRIDAELFQMFQTSRYRGKLAGQVVVLLVVECADMQLVDDELVPRRQVQVVPRPVKAPVVDDGVADRIGHLAGIRVNALELALRCCQPELVLIADTSHGYVGVPGAVLLSLHGVFVAVPSVERSDDGCSLRIRCPHAERDSLRVKDRSHAFVLRFIAHAWLQGVWSPQS